MSALDIKQIDEVAVHKICSGQVVLTLAIAAKELIENSLDAGSTSIDVRFKDHGLESIEVTDNGKGIKEDNFKSLTLKHYTSKLTDFHEISDLSTFGFRGEALSSLCALANVSVTTRHESADIGTRLEFDHTGSINNQTVCARQCGTSVVVKNLFSTLSVRHKEFQRNIKKEFTKALSVITAYALINTGVRITCSNVNADSMKKQTVMSTSSNETVRENFINLFGIKSSSSMCDLIQQPLSPAVCNEFSLQHPFSSPIPFSLSGLISNCHHGAGRSCGDRQFLFVNKRPWDNPKIVRVINDVYHTYNRSQFPAVVLHIATESDKLDVNVTPDKRKLFIHNEKLLLAVIKGSLIDLYDRTSCMYQDNTSTQLTLTDFDRTLSGENKDLEVSPVTTTKPKFSNASPSTESISSLKRSFSSSFSKLKCLNDDIRSSLCKNRRLSTQENSQKSLRDFVKLRDMNDTRQKSTECIVPHDQSCESIGHINKIRDTGEPVIDTTGTCTSVDGCTHDGPENGLRDDDASDMTYDHPDERPQVTDEFAFFPENHSSTPDSVNKQSLTCNDTCGNGARNITYDEEVCKGRLTKIISFSLVNLKTLYDQHRGDSDRDEFHRAFRAKISVEDNLSAEAELQKEITKDCFSKMEIIGQFNLGFILAKYAHDLFIIDQHASDEKVNFERLQLSTTIQSQTLISPLSLELSASNETILMSNLDIFERNGFHLIVNENELPSHKVSLVAVPQSKNWIFGKGDIEEMIFMLSESPGEMCRPSRIRQMFASRACRSSVMVGTALDHPAMKQILKQMGEIEQPWNCPHGRPTMRHLINLQMIQE